MCQLLIQIIGIIVLVSDRTFPLSYPNSATPDFDNLIEEIESWGRSQKHELENRLGELFEHILKRTYVNMPDCYRGWVESIDKQRVSIKRLLKQAPSLKPYFSQVFDEVYEDTLKIVRRSYSQCEFPDIWPFSCDIDAMLNVDFWEE
jgi:hypothetical protein